MLKVRLKSHAIKECQVVEVHLMNMNKQVVTWKLHYHNLSMWVFSN